jgi:hypothetical protein
LLPPGFAARSGFEIGPIALEATPGSSLVYAVGTIRNPADRQRFGVRIELDLLDASGTKIGTAKDYQGVLEAKGQWRFKALVLESHAASAILGSISEEK